MTNNKDPYQPIVEDGSVSRVLELTAHATDAQLDAFSRDLSGDQVLKISMWTSAKIRTRGVQSVLVNGCLLHLYSRATMTEDDQTLFDNMLDDIGLSRTQAYRCIGAWKACGSVLAKEPELVSQFVSESLKMLAAESSPAAAIEAAIERARTGERITIKLAEQLQQEFGSSDELDIGAAPPPIEKPAKGNKQSPRQQAKGKRESSQDTVFSFLGKVVRLVVEPTKPSSRPDLASVILDLETAVEQLLRKIDNLKNQSEPSDAA